jgi:hypothetical protein
MLFFNFNHGHEYVVPCYVRYDHAHERFQPRYGYLGDLSNVYVHGNEHEGADANARCSHEYVHVHVHECARGHEDSYGYDDVFGSWRSPLLFI